MESISGEYSTAPACSEQQDELYTILNQNVQYEKVAMEFFAMLKALQIDQFEKKLGAGATGSVFQVIGKGEFHQIPLALKVFKYSKEHVFSNSDPRGEAIGLALPSNAHLGNALGVFTYDGKEMHFSKTYNPVAMNNQIVMGVLSNVIPGKTLSSLFEGNQTFSKKEIQQMGRQLVRAIRNLHDSGYAHKDIHAENVLVDKNKEGFTAHLIDFGLACPLSEKRSRTDWRKFGYLLAEMGGKKLFGDLLFFDLLYSEKKGILNGKKPYSEKEIENHPFFKPY